MLQIGVLQSQVVSLQEQLESSSRECASWQADSGQQAKQVAALQVISKQWLCPRKMSTLLGTT